MRPTPSPRSAWNEPNVPYPRISICMERRRHPTRGTNPPYLPQTRTTTPGTRNEAIAHLRPACMPLHPAQERTHCSGRLDQHSTARASHITVHTSLLPQPRTRTRQRPVPLSRNEPNVHYPRISICMEQTHYQHRETRPSPCSRNEPMLSLPSGFNRRPPLPSGFNRRLQPHQQERTHLSKQGNMRY